MFPAELAVTLNGVKFIGGNDAKCVTPVEILLSFDSVVIRRCSHPPFRQEEGKRIKECNTREFTSSKYY